MNKTDRQASDQAKAALAAYEATPDEPAGWTKTTPTEQGTYWHWNGDQDSGPLPLFVLWSGSTGKCFVSANQVGITDAIDCGEYGGWWLSLPDPALPGAKATPDEKPGADWMRAAAKEIAELLDIVPSDELDNADLTAIIARHCPRAPQPAADWMQSCVKDLNDFYLGHRNSDPEVAAIITKHAPAQPAAVSANAVTLADVKKNIARSREGLPVLTEMWNSALRVISAAEANLKVERAAKAQPCS